MTRTLVTGGVRCGKSAVAEGLLADVEAVTYVACGRRGDAADPEWAARVAAHQQRRPQHWATVETTDLLRVLAAPDTPVLVDCLGTWLTARLDALGAWHEDDGGWAEQIAAETAELAAAVQRCPQPLVLVSNEVGWGLVSEHRSGRIFADRLGWLNQAVAAVCDDVLLVVAGRVIKL